MNSSDRGLSQAGSRLGWLAIVSAIVLAVGCAIVPERIWSNLLIVGVYLVTLALGGTLFIALTYISNASWNVAFRRVPEAMAVVLAPAGLGLLAVLAARARQYAWHPHNGEGDAGTFWFKELWTNPTFWMVRAVGYSAVWLLLSRMLIAASRRQDHSKGLGLTLFNRRLSAIFLLVYAPTFALASCDWLMLLDPMWFSTIFGVYNFAGMVQATLAAMIILAIILRRRGPLHGVFTDDHLHDLSKLLLGFSCFWMYIWFSQYMLIWYTNMPEETAYYLLRTRGPWGPLTITNVALNWGIPFFTLLPRPWKRSESVMLKIATIILLGRWLDLYIMVFPATVGSTPVFGLWEAAGCGLAVGLFGWSFFRVFTKASPIPSGDPMLAESLHYHC
jgi:hypothetical protein